MGELSDPRKALMPVAAALGGMVVPAIIYVIVNLNGNHLHGWGIPMATDIAFTLRLMAIIGNRAPLSLKVFISALAVADDLGAILVIAIFYGHEFHIEYFSIGIVIALLMFLLNRLRVYAVVPYIILSVATQTLIIFKHEMQKNRREDQRSDIDHKSLHLLRNAIECLRDPGYYLKSSLEK